MKKDNNNITKKTKKLSTFLKRATKPKEPPKEKVSKPKSYTFRKAGAVTFWVLFGFMFLVVFVNVFSTSPSSNAMEEVTQEINHTVQPEAIQFAIDFTSEYFTWDKEDMEKRQERLDHYLSVDMDENAGLDITNLTWNSTFQNATLQNVEEINENKSHIVLRVESKLVGEGKKKKDREEKQLNKYFVVPVGYDGDNLGVYSAPYFTNIDNEEKSQVTNSNLTRGLNKPDNSDEARNIENFLDTFFTSYAEDSPDKLSYILNDQSTVGLNGAMNFVEVKKSDVYQGKGENEFIVYAEVTFSEPDSELYFDSTYHLLVSKDDNRYVVDQMNAENYIQEMTGNSTISTEEPDEESESEETEGSEEADSTDVDSESEDDEDNEE